LRNIIKIGISLVFIFLFFGCSTKKDAFVNRTYHGISTKYNVLYNGQLALDDGLASLNANYEDNYWEVLPIEPLKVDELALPGMQVNTDNSPQEFDRAEEKAVKAIQKHSMLIARQERNNQIDAAYLLLGKSRYYSQRFVPAMEAFNYIMINYPRADLIDENWIWKAKTNVRLQNEDIAIEALKILLEKETLSSKNREDAHTVMAMAYQKSDSLDQEINHLKLATLTQNNKEQTARNLFILGQLYRIKNEIDSSNIAFQKIVDLKKAPHKYLIHAQIEQAKNVSSDEEANLMAEKLKELIDDRYNRAYLDELYFRLAEVTLESNEDLALDYYKQAVLASNSANLQKELAYESIGNVYFNKAEFSVAGAYYDSVLQISRDENSKRIRSLKRKRNNLEEVIIFETVAKQSDSILGVVAMSHDEQLAFYTNYIETLKAEDKRKKELEEIQKLNAGSNFFGTENTNLTKPDGKWYFYNTQASGYGQQEFRNTWGNRPLEDNWRLSDKVQINTSKNAQTITTVNGVDNAKRYDIMYYLNQIPSNPIVIDSISLARNNAYYKLGIIYESQFKETDLAISKLEKLLTFNPSEEIELPTKYHLYKMYLNVNQEKSQFYKNEITSNYPNSKYAQIILNPSEVISEDQVSKSEIEYAEIYYKYEAEQYDEVISKTTEAIGKYNGQIIVPKFELLKAYAIGKKDGLLAFKEALDFIAMNYPNTEEAKKALEVLQTINSKI
jgi:tetratricopeptide (TPR) repeat protein